MRPIDGDALIEILTTAIRNVQGVTKFIGAENDPEIKMAIKCYTDILDGVKEQPTIELEPRWIPCSDRLPERKSGEYLCTSKWLEEDAEEVKVLEWDRVSKTANDCKKHPEMIAGRTFDGWGFGEDWYGKIDNVEKVSAWMPMPEPYKEDDE